MSLDRYTDMRGEPIPPEELPPLEVPPSPASITAASIGAAKNRTTVPARGGASGSAGPEVVPGSPLRGGNRGTSATVIHAPGSGNHREPAEPPTATGREQSPASGPIFESLCAFLERAANAPPFSWLVPDVVPDSGSVLIVAEPNAGKTWFSLAIAQAAANRGREVFMVEEEGGVAGLASRLKNLALGPDAPVHIALNRGVRVDDRAMREALISAMRSADAPVLVLDPLASMFVGDENNTADANAVAHFLREIQRANPRLLLVVAHHTPKGWKEHAPIFAARGSSVFTGWADAQLILEELDAPPGNISFKVTVAKMRDDEKGQRRSFNIDRSTGLVTMSKEGAEAGTADRSGDLLRVLTKASAPMSKNAICKALGGKRSAVLRAVDELERDQKITKGPGGYSRCSLSVPVGQLGASDCA